MLKRKQRQQIIQGSSHNMTGAKQPGRAATTQPSGGIAAAGEPGRIPPHGNYCHSKKSVSFS